MITPKSRGAKTEQIGSVANKACDTAIITVAFVDNIFAEVDYKSLPIFLQTSEGSKSTNTSLVFIGNEYNFCQIILCCYKSFFVKRRHIVN